MVFNDIDACVYVWCWKHHLFCFPCSKIINISLSLSFGYNYYSKSASFRQEGKEGEEEGQIGSDVEGIRTFVKAMKKMHFKLQKKDASNKMFVLFRFRRTKKSSAKMPDVFEWNFKPCLYKKR